MDDDLTRLNPDYIKLQRAFAALVAAPVLLAALVADIAAPFVPGAIAGPVAVLALLAILRVPLRRHLARGFAMGTDRLRVVRGLLVRSDTVVPFGRVQHIDVNQGPLERVWNLATLTLHTAGTHNASVRLPGLAHADALAMRETIRAHIRREGV